SPPPPKKIQTLAILLHTFLPSLINGFSMKLKVIYATTINIAQAKIIFAKPGPELYIGIHDSFVMRIALTAP
ncbi:TPA: hypothetical protein ACNBOE_004846, partial [Escherichia coli]